MTKGGLNDFYLPVSLFGVWLAEPGFSIEYITENNALATDWFSVILFFCFPYEHFFYTKMLFISGGECSVETQNHSKLELWLL